MTVRVRVGARVRAKVRVRVRVRVRGPETRTVSRREPGAKLERADP